METRATAKASGEWGAIALASAFMLVYALWKLTFARVAPSTQDPDVAPAARAPRARSKPKKKSGRDMAVDVLLALIRAATFAGPVIYWLATRK